MEEVKYEICQSPWCKATFAYKEYEMIQDEEGNLKAPKFCQKCKSFDTELSGGTSWKDKEYEGDRWDGMSHPISYRIKKYY